MAQNMHYQAITTRFHGPTNSRESRITARAAAGRVTVHYDHGLNQRTNHAVAAKALAEKCGWSGMWCSGGLPDGRGDVFVLVANYRPVNELTDFEPAFVVLPT